MKVTKFINLVAIGLSLIVTVSGCKHKPVNVTQLPGSRAGNPGDMPPGNQVGNGNGTEGGGMNVTDVAQPPPGTFNGPRNEQIFSGDTVHFDYDSSVVKDSEKSKVAKVADHLKADS